MLMGNSVTNKLTHSVRFHIFVSTVVFVFALILTGCLYKYFQQASLLLLTYACGAVGGLTNNYMRLRDVPIKLDEFDNSNSNVLAILQVYVTPVIAGIFGMVAYLLFAAGILQGKLFPAFEGMTKEYESVIGLFTGGHPKTLEDASKALFWAFLAGFSERMIPNILDRLATESKDGARDVNNQR